MSKSMSKFGVAALVIWVALSLAGCAGKGPWGKKYEPGAQQPGTEQGAQQGTGAGKEGEERHGAELGGTFKGSPLDNPDSPLSKRTFYFDFDSSQVKADDRKVIAAHGQYLADHPKLSVVVEGHTDERGSREYNMALGQRRAESVAQILYLQGAAKTQVQVISFGEERPVALGHDEAAWRLNRRVEILYSGNQ